MVEGGLHVEMRKGMVRAFVNGRYSGSALDPAMRCTCFVSLLFVCSTYPLDVARRYFILQLCMHRVVASSCEVSQELDNSRQDLR